ncbi:MAG: tryptophan-rich sensory protein [Candidatus ainarchaeum sp.]|nr:tryptophan-rich sensory protein [Candidatus ainarchaeum sp.]
MDYRKLSFSLILCLFAGYLGSVLNSVSINTWYPTIIKPSFTPASIIFPIVWTILYILMGISLYIILVKNSVHYKKLLMIFSVQLVLNVLWSFFFFTLKSPLLGLIEIIILDIAVLVNMIYFYKVSKTATYLLSPYFAWIIFATILNISIFILN